MKTRKIRTKISFSRGAQYIYCDRCGWETTTYYASQTKAIDVAYGHDRLHARKDAHE